MTELLKKIEIVAGTKPELNSEFQAVFRRISSNSAKDGGNVVNNEMVLEYFLRSALNRKLSNYSNLQPKDKLYVDCVLKVLASDMKEEKCGWIVGEYQLIKGDLDSSNLNDDIISNITRDIWTEISIWRQEIAPFFIESSLKTNETEANFSFLEMQQWLQFLCDKKQRQERDLAKLTFELLNQRKRLISLMNLSMKKFAELAHDEKGHENAHRLTTYVEWLCLKVQTLLLKLRLTLCEMKADIYQPEDVQILKLVRQVLERKKIDLYRERMNLTELKSAYKSLGSEFLQLLSTFQNLSSELSNKKWALSQLN